jgi:hypothetical protein
MTWGFMITLAGQLIASPAFAGDDITLGVQEFSIVCPTAILELDKLDSLLKNRSFAESDRDGDEDSEVVSFKQSDTKLILEFSGSPVGAQRTEIWACKLFMELPTQMERLNKTFDNLMRDPRLSGMRKLRPRPVAGVAELKANKEAGDGCLYVWLTSFDTSNQRTTDLVLGRTHTPCEDSTR